MTRPGGSRTSSAHTSSHSEPGNVGRGIAALERSQPMSLGVDEPHPIDFFSGGLGFLAAPFGGCSMARLPATDARLRVSL